ncbi:MAG: hypothetical protein ACFE8L_00465 [Candidatus Hodarchaeota archaeon]
MRNKLIALLLLLLGLSLFTLGIMDSQFSLISQFYEQMAAIP